LTARGQSTINGHSPKLFPLVSARSLQIGGIAEIQSAVQMSAMVKHMRMAILGIAEIFNGAQDGMEAGGKNGVTPIPSSLRRQGARSLDWVKLSSSF
jgi:hypothetical protein